MPVARSPAAAGDGRGGWGELVGGGGPLGVVARGGIAPDTGQLMQGSPSITATDASHFTVAFQGADSVLWTYSSATGPHRTGLPMRGSTSPSATMTSAGVAIAYVSGTNNDLAILDPVAGFGDSRNPLAPATSPATTDILGAPDGYRIAS